MKVYVTNAQFAEVRELELQREFDDGVTPKLAALLSRCHRENGGDFDPDQAMAGEETAIIVIEQ